ncbi:hypothetical protein SEA_BENITOANTONIO_63 [Arthrobacter phage BenitoAntonio]|uniref:Uncharacterized protein n=2 Tax=Mudcatvirus TaxID=1982088 RepID=A0AAE9BRX6_9CAUD|nr:hypothetical protein PQB81_gp064 [Arthrobacter phage Kardesai]YP_010666844.1 hypothetical protein PQB82_gp65 [Arthrobacter phage Dynamite]QFP95033.1 hypothetical protein SEA_NAPOLEONB_65 [Arthrobacter phage NapoleonB]UYL87326.1 hypothetical protein SEA_BENITOANTONIO_63 [Arthrobacter phage BenitoAntonio]QXO12971.1 hypothetical protein SEA_KARDESAI_64 [Arthrobacter phage Kardesai]UAW09226.1 hypothetical protein SEA_DYNAMITE_65 [Arthrobacter phage Dynamite]
MQGFDLTASILGLSTKNLAVLDSTDADIWSLTIMASNATRPAKNVGGSVTPNVQQISKKV